MLRGGSSQHLGFLGGEIARWSIAQPRAVFTSPLDGVPKGEGGELESLLAVIFLDLN